MIRNYERGGTTRQVLARLEIPPDYEEEVGETLILIRVGDHYVIENSNGYSMRYIDIHEAIGGMINELLSIEQGEKWFPESRGEN